MIILKIIGVLLAVVVLSPLAVYLVIAIILGHLQLWPVVKDLFRGWFA